MSIDSNIKNNKKEKIIIFLLLQVMNILYSLDSVMIKMVSVRWEKNGLFSVSTLLLLTAAFAVLALYALLWQNILSRVDLTVAYMCKGMIIFWGMLWAFLFFKEKITLFNIIGTVIIFCGTYLVTTNE
ncbi:MAG: EamA family transporter [Lachnospiraceae bacterium]|nr:EamA family transporter [Lachnospiraceae bacterium]